jgi:predicted amidohydrolase YtcJ
MHLIRVARTVPIALLMSLGGSRDVARGADPPVTVIRAVTVISAERATPLQHAYVRIANGRITDVSTHALTGDLAVDGRGRFLIPGLIDSHTHLRSTSGMQAPQRAAHPDLVAQADAQEPRSYVYFGFTVAERIERDGGLGGHFASAAVPTA